MGQLKRLDKTRLVGKKYGKLKVIEFSHVRNRYSYWSVICDCGNTKVVQGHCLTTGNTKSCGCSNRNRFIKMNTTHNKHGTAEYRVWLGMKARTNIPSATGYHNYGGRGIKVCDRWLESFENFLKDMGLKPTPEHSIDRVDVNGNYEPSNCRWATKAEQLANRRRYVRKSLFMEYCKYGHKMVITNLRKNYTGGVMCWKCYHIRDAKHKLKRKKVNIAVI